MKQFNPMLWAEHDVMVDGLYKYDDKTQTKHVIRYAQMYDYWHSGMNKQIDCQLQTLKQ